MVKDLNSYELAGLEYIAALDSQLIHSERHLEDRIKDIPGAWEKYQTAKDCIANVLDSLYETVPDKTLRHMQRLAQSGEIIIRQKPIVKSDFDQLVPTDVLKLLVNHTMESQCAICFKTGKEVERCKLRRSLMLVAPPDVVNENGCSYSDVALQNERGKYI